jgi:hypothetical protein
LRLPEANVTYALVAGVGRPLLPPTLWLIEKVLDFTVGYILQNSRQFLVAIQFQFFQKCQVSPDMLLHLQENPKTHSQLSTRCQGPTFLGLSSGCKVLAHKDCMELQSVIEHLRLG